MTRHGEERFHEAWQQSETLDDHAGFLREAEEVFDDQVEALALEPMERLEHGFRGSVDPALVHVHGNELAQQQRVSGRAPAGVIRHHVVGGVEMQTVLSCYATSSGRLARSAPAADPVDVAEFF